MQVLFDSWLALRQNVVAAAAIAACIAWGGVTVAAALRSAQQPYQLKAADRLALALGGWLLPVLLLSVLLFLAGTFARARLSLSAVVAFLLLSAAGVLYRSRRTPWPISAQDRAATLVLALTLPGLLALRLAFIARMTLPLYFDSAEHYRIIQSLVRDYGAAASSPPPAWPAPAYYHIGLHVVLAVVAAISGAGVSQLLLVAGQFLLATLPMAVFFIVHRETGSTSAGLLAVVLAALGWYLPAYAVNWGKYPALFSLPVIIFTLDAAYLASKGARSFRLIALLSFAAAFLIHTRSIVILGMMCTAWAVAAWWMGRSRLQRLALLALTILAMILVALVVARNTVLAPLLDPYLGRGMWITGLVGLLSVPAVLKYPRLAFASLLATVFLLVGLFIPGLVLPNATLLDRPLVEMVMFLPMSMLGAAGWAGAAQLLAPERRLSEAAALVLVCLAIGILSLSTYGLYPSACCVLAGPDDIVALDWLGKNVPAEAQVLISSEQVSFVPAPYAAQSVASDAGVWITPLTGRQTSYLAYSSDFGAADTLATICGRGVDYIFVGSVVHSFEGKSLEPRPDWYESLLLLPHARIYRVVGCEP